LQGRTQWVLAAIPGELWPFLHIDKVDWLVESIVRERIGPTFGFAVNGVPLQPVGIRSIGSVSLSARIASIVVVGGR